MNKNIKSFLFLLILFTGQAFSEQKDIKESPHETSQEVERVEDLIDVSKLNVTMLTQLKNSIEKYQLLQLQYMKDPEDNEVLYQMVKEAYAILDVIKKNQLTALFDPAFISELTIVSKPATKLGLPKP